MALPSLGRGAAAHRFLLGTLISGLFKVGSQVYLPKQKKQLSAYPTPSTDYQWVSTKLSAHHPHIIRLLFVRIFSIDCSVSCVRKKQRPSDENPTCSDRNQSCAFHAEGHPLFLRMQADLLEDGTYIDMSPL